MKIMKHISTILILGGTLFAQHPSGLEITQKVYNRPVSKTMEAKLSMTLENSRGDQRVREINQFTKEFGTVEKKLMVFLKPNDVKNTTFMNWSFEDGSEDQWIYLPALKKIKRISSDSDSDYFMGSDFTYDDLGDRHPKEDTHTLLGEEIIDGHDCYIVESIPVDEEYMYSKTVTWIIKNKWIGYKKEFYDEDEDLLKRLSLVQYDEYDSVIVLTEVKMNNIQTDHSTIMKLTEVEVNKAIADNMFTERMMKRGLR
ncbi:MAG: outer membrane lipoprotein-sorting protein [Candidatus Marinimicrobia bacterium]|nr:outer membrane lipoprotein-sorting protein [Candidatus Neomarinimicrobiota bacterium]